MKKRYITVVLFVAFLSGSFSIAQVTKAEIIYKVKVDRQDKNNSETKPSKRVNMILEEIENIRMEFLYNEDKGSFGAAADLELDYMTKFNRRSAKNITGVGRNYYYDIHEKKVISDREIEGSTYNIVYKLNGFEWELHNETKTIHNYVCYKATTTYSYKNRKGTITNIDVTAWYAPQIPIPLGPKNYTGLPGLVLELKEGTIIIYVTELTLNPSRKIKIDKIPEGKEISEEEFKRIAAKAYSNFMDSMKKN